MYKSRLTKKKIISDSNFIRTDHYLILNPGLTHFKSQQVITFKTLIKYLIQYGKNTFTYLNHIQ